MARRGFTLIELMVVIAIIAILISLSIVGLGATRRTSRTLQCQVQLRQVGTALEVMRDRDGLLPSMRPPTVPSSKGRFIAMYLEFMNRWYAAASATLAPSSDARLTSLGWLLWSAPKPWRCPADDPTNIIGVAHLNSLGYDPAWPLAAQVGTSYEYIGTSPSYGPLVRGKASETAMRRALTQASERYPSVPLLYDAVPFHQESPRRQRSQDTNAYFQDGSTSAMLKFTGEDAVSQFGTYVHAKFIEK
ncbi:MAG TPA: prepilin-type N-terminal cleavage/methylation domain-containing protein [Phycisphaerales bacterium]